MDGKKDLRQNIWAKFIAIVLFFAAASAAGIGTFAVIYISCGYGTAPSFQDDPLCRNGMSRAMNWALDYVLTENGDYDYWMYSAQFDLERTAGFSAQVYGEDGALIGGWGEVPDEASTLAVATETYRYAQGTFTVKGYVSMDLPAGSNFAVRQGMYMRLRALPFGVTVLLTVLLYVLALAALVFLFCAAGHKAGREGISLNWQDRIPLDLYLLLAMGLLGLATTPAMSVNGGPMALEIASLCLTIFLCAAVSLAALLTLAARFKRGKWWRNTLCWRLYRWCARTWKRCWRAFAELVRILPLTWRAILAALCVLGGQSLLSLLIVETYSEGFFFFLVMAALDAALVAGAAWLSLQLQQVRDMGAALAAGDLEAQLDTEKMYFDVKRHAEDLNAIGVGMNKAVEQRLKSERLKTELITNVSHDIKTPLTSIVSYVDLLKKEELSPTAGEYVAVLDRQSRRLKKLTEDLVEASKASTGNIAVQLEPIVVNEIIHQAVGDYDEKLAAGRLEVIVNTYEGNLMALADGRLLWRVLDNLLSNVCKYAMAGTRVYVDLIARDGHVVLSIKNISRDPLNISADELMERFVRGDASRHTEGSGLGLNIAKSFMDLMGGGFALSVDGDLFKAELTLRA